MFNLNSNPVSRRGLLRGAAGAAIALPILESSQQAIASSTKIENTPRRLVAMNFALGLYGKAFFPESAGKDYEFSPYLERLKDHRQDFTVISGLYHDGVGGGHASEPCIFTGTPNTGGGKFRNGISLDQLVSEKIGTHTRFESMRVGHQRTRISSNRQGVSLPFETDVQTVYRKLFGVDDARDRELHRRRLKTGQSILDLVGDSARRMRGKMSTLDRTKVDEYFESVRDIELRLAKEESWFDKPKPQVDMEFPKSNFGGKNYVLQRMRLFFDLIYLALQTDSTRCVVYAAPTNDTVLLPGENITNSYHNLTHHGHDPDKIRQMKLIELAFMDELNRFIERLSEAREDDERLLDRTNVLITSNLGNGAGHGCKNLPVLVAGGRLKHGQHLKFEPPNTTPLSNLYVSLLQNLGLEVEQFSHSSGPLRGIDRI